MLHFTHLHDKYDKTNFALFRFHLKLLSIFTVMVNIVKISLISATENFLQNIFSFKIFVELWLTHPICSSKFWV